MRKARDPIFFRIGDSVCISGENADRAHGGGLDRHHPKANLRRAEIQQSKPNQLDARPGIEFEYQRRFHACPRLSERALKCYWP